MTIKDIHVHVYNEATCGTRLETAVDLATRLNAHLTGLYVRRAFPIPPPMEDKYSLNQDLADQVIFTAGRPCLLIPYARTSIGFGQTPLIAWDGSREAARAIHDAIPLLKMADKVTVLINQPERVKTDFGDLLGAMISEHLARHDINAVVEVLRGEVQDTSDAILSYVDAYGHDLLVMGAYGHSRWREIVLGGVTRTIMAETKIPY